MSTAANSQGGHLAFLGMGIMGASMACNLLKAGFNVHVWNRTESREGLARAQDAGARRAFSVSEAVHGAEFVILCLTDVPDLEEVILGESGVLSSAKPGAILIDMGTSGPECAKKLSSILESKGMHFVDAPVSGGDVGARDGTLTIMVGAEKAIYERCLPLFQGMGKKIQHCGPVGAGQAVKLCNQILCAVNMLAVCESLDLAEHLGIDRNLMIEVCGSGAAGSWALTNLGPRITAGNLEPGFMIKDMRKDLRLVREALHAASSELEATLLADRKFVEAVQKLGEGGERKGTQAMSVAYGK